MIDVYQRRWDKIDLLAIRSLIKVLVATLAKIFGEFLIQYH